MNQELKEIFRKDIEIFAEKIRAFEAGEIDRKTYKSISGGFGSYAQREGGHMLRLPMAGGRLTKERLRFLAESVEKYGISRMKLTICQTVQLHNLSADETVELMKNALNAGIVTRGAGGDFPRNAMASPLSGVEQGEYFDVLPCAEMTAEHLQGLIPTIHLPRKLKVAFSNSPQNKTHATFRDLGFAAREDGKFDVYLAGGLGPGAKMGVKAAEAVEPECVLVCVDAMILVFTEFGNYENRAWSRSRFLQDRLGVEGIKAEFAKALVKTMETSEKLSVQVRRVEKVSNGTFKGERVIPQKQKGLYTVCYHPVGGVLPVDKPRRIYQTIKDMSEVECRISPDGTLYIINLAVLEVPAVLEATMDSAVMPFERSVCCIGASICQHGMRDSQALLTEMIEAVRKAKLPANALPRVHISGCPSSCGTQQVGTMGFQGGVKRVDGEMKPAFAVFLGGKEKQGEERMGEPIGFMIQERIPEFMVEMGRMVVDSGMSFEEWIEKKEREFMALAERYVVK